MNRAQTRLLNAYVHFQHKDMSVSALLWLNRRIYAIIVPVGLITSWTFYSYGGPVWAYVAGVAYLALIIRDVAYYRKSAAVWPLLREILDWPKIHQIASEPRRST
jgi:hypothetical protein